MNRFKQPTRVLAQFNPFQGTLFKRMKMDFFNKINRLKKSIVIVKFKLSISIDDLIRSEKSNCKSNCCARVSVIHLENLQQFKLTNCNKFGSTNSIHMWINFLESCLFKGVVINLFCRLASTINLRYCLRILISFEWKENFCIYFC